MEKDYESINQDLIRVEEDEHDLDLRIRRLEKFTQGLLSKSQMTGSGAQDLLHLARLSYKVDKILAAFALQEDNFDAIPHRFPKAYVRHMMMTLSLPGTKVFGEQKPHLHTWVWIFVHLLTLILSFVYIKEQYDKWQTSPVVKILTNNMTYNRELPFPAITICLPFSFNQDYDYVANEARCFTSKEYNGTKTCRYDDECSFEDKAMFAVASLACLRETDPTCPPWYVFNETVQSFLKFEDSSRYAKTVFPPYDVYLRHERRSKKNYFEDLGNGYQYFASRLGMCLTINSLRHNDIYKKSTVVFQPVVPEPPRDNYVGADYFFENMIYFRGNFSTVPAYVGQDVEMTFVIGSRKNTTINQFCTLNQISENINGNIVLHNPGDIPLPISSDFTMKIGETKNIFVTPQLIVTDAELKSYKPADRGCYYSHERELALFQRYSQKNCNIECVVNCSLRFCGCVPLYHPRPSVSSNTCLGDCRPATTCLCGCLPDCFSLRYELHKVEGIPKPSELSYIHVSYEKAAFYSEVRVSLTNLAEFIAYSLGIIGMFNGFNVMVVFELLYFFTFKLWVSVKGS